MYVDKTAIGITAIKDYQIDTGIRLEKQVNIGLELSGYKSRVKKVTLKGGQEFSWDVPLKKMATQPVLPKPKPDIRETIVEKDEKDVSVNETELEKMTNEPVSPKPKPGVSERIVEEDVSISKRERLPSIDLPQRIVGKDGAEMVLIPAGDFQMGSNQFSSSEQPVHTVYVDAFYMDVHEVAVEQYNQFVRATGHRAPPQPGFLLTDRHPIVNVSWHDAMAYAKWAGKRLPIEAEWEYAARGGLEGQKYPWGNTPPDGTQCNFADKSLSKVGDSEWTVQIAKQPTKKVGDDWSNKYVDDGYASTAPVGSYPPNGYGLYDMAGNVWEWCFDAYDENFYASSPHRNPIAGIIITDAENDIVAVNELRSSRGGSWLSSAVAVQVFVRGNGAIPTGMWTTNGFRCARAVKP